MELMSLLQEMYMITQKVRLETFIEKTINKKIFIIFVC